MEGAVADAKRKFARQRAIRGIVFINLIALSFAELLVEEEIERDYAEWADGLERDDPSIELVLVRGYEWRAPFRQPASLQPING